MAAGSEGKTESISQSSSSSEHDGSSNYANIQLLLTFCTLSLRLANLPGSFVPFSTAPIWRIETVVRYLFIPAHPHHYFLRPIWTTNKPIP